MFGRKQQIVVDSGVTVSMSKQGVAIEGGSEEFAATLVAYWAENFGNSPEPKANPIGFSISEDPEEE